MAWRSAWLGVSAVALAALVACHHDDVGSPNGDDDDGGRDGPCTCDLGGGASLPCGLSTCSGGTLILCSVGTPLDEGACFEVDAGEPAEASAGEEGSCVPVCNGVTCGEADSCGSVCKCAAGIDCIAGTCAAACSVLAGSPCVPGSADPTTCCGEGDQCVVGDSGIGICCALTMTSTQIGGLCETSADCCAYPSATCNPATGTCQ